MPGGKGVHPLSACNLCPRNFGLGAAGWAFTTATCEPAVGKPEQNQGHSQVEDKLLHHLGSMKPYEYWQLVQEFDRPWRFKAYVSCVVGLFFCGAAMGKYRKESAQWHTCAPFQRTQAKIPRNRSRNILSHGGVPRTQTRWAVPQSSRVVVRVPLRAHKKVQTVCHENGLQKVRKLQLEAPNWRCRRHPCSVERDGKKFRQKKNICGAKEPNGLRPDGQPARNSSKIGVLGSLGTPFCGRFLSRKQSPKGNPLRETVH